MFEFDRREVLVGLLGAAAAARVVIWLNEPAEDGDPDYAEIYGPQTDGKITVPAVDLSKIEHVYLRKTIRLRSKEKPGTIVVDPVHRFLYFIKDANSAVRYGVAVGKPGFAWSGVASVKAKQEWPDWYPPRQMLERKPELARKLSTLQSGEGMPGGIENPLGARALYLYQGERDTLYRIHGTNEPASIGHRASSGCIRMINQDVIDLYGRVAVSARVVVEPPTRRRAKANVVASL